MKSEKPLKTRRKKPAPNASGEKISSAHRAYGDKKPICVNAKCQLRKKAKCYGFEGCPGFK